MEKLYNSSVTESKKSEMICHGIGLPKVDSSPEKEDRSCGVEHNFGNKMDERMKNDTGPLRIPKLHSEIEKIKTITSPESLINQNQTELDSKVSQRNPIVMEVKRLEMQKEALENKAEELKRKITKRKLEKKTRESYLLQIKNIEKKIEMLGKRISYEKRFTYPPILRCSVKTLKKTSKSLYVNSLRSDEILTRKMTSKLVLKDASGLQSKLSDEINLIEEQTVKDKKKENLEKWQKHWKELVSEEESDEELESLGAVIKKPKRTTVFYPPIPDPTAKKRPKDMKPAVNEEETGDCRNNSKTRIRLVPNRKRVLQNRVSLLRKQLEFERRHDLDMEDTIKNLDRVVLSYQQFLNDDEHLPSITKQQLQLMGALTQERTSS